MGKVICLGEALIDFVPTENGLKLEAVNNFKRVAGGAPANVCAAIASLGGTSYMVGKVGDDPFGSFLIETLKTKGVHVDYLLKSKEAKTALAFVSLQNDGERDFMFYRDPSADMLLHKREIQAEWFKGATIFHYGSISLINEPVKGATLEAIRKASEDNLIISFDPNIRMPLWNKEEDAKTEILNCIPLSHIVKVSEEELFFLTNEANELKAVQSLMTDRVKFIVVTKGKDGCAYYTRNTHGFVKGIVVDAIDTTGAGDAFVGGLLYCLSKNINSLEEFIFILQDTIKLENFLFFANTCGALTTTKRGAIPALPTLEEIHAY